MEVEKSAEEYSKEELRRQLYASLRSTGVLDSMKGQLRARLLEHLRHHNEDLIEPKKKQKKPSLIERLLSSLFLDYLESNGFTFTVSVFVPESQMASWPPFSYEEMLDLLHLDPSSDLHIRLKLDGEGRECLAHQLVTVLQQMANRSSIQEVSTQTSPAEACKRAMRTSCTSPKELERSIKEIEDVYIRKKKAYDAQRALPYRSLEDKSTALHQEFDARVNAEVALQVSCIRDHEVNAVRMDEAAHNRRQLARDQEELEDIHKSRMDRVKAREESLVERMLSKEKAIEASAYEHRQKILLEITSLRERENKLRHFKESQERREEKLNERELSLRAKEEEVMLERKALYAQADEIAASRRKELEEQYKELCDRLHHDQTLLGAEREQLKEEKVVMAIELAASRSDKELIQALHRRLSMEEDQRLKLDMSIRELEEKLKQQTSSAPALASIPDQRLEERLRELQAELELERFQRQASVKEKKTLERKLQQKKVELAAARTPQAEWITEHKNLMATIYKQEAELQKKETKLQLMETEKEKLTNRHKKLLFQIDHLDTLVKKAQEEKDHAVYNLEILQVQQTTNESELLDTTTLLRKAQQALETERLEHCALRSHMNAIVPSTRDDLNSVTLGRDYGFQDKLEHSSGLFDPKSSVAAPFGKKWESSQKKPKPESHELWTQLLSENAAKKAPLGQDLERTSLNHFPTPIAKLPSAGNGEAKSSNSNDLNGLTAVTVEKLRTVKEGIAIVTNTKAFMETVVDGSIEGYTSSWDQEKYGEHNEDAIPSWRTYLAEVATPTSWNNYYKDSLSSVQGLVTNLQYNKSEAPISDFSSGKDPMLSWNKTYFEGEERSAEKSDKELLSDVQGTEMTTEFRSANMLEFNSPKGNLQNLENSDTPVDQIAFPNLNRPEGKEDDANRDSDGDLIVHGITGVTHSAQEDDEHLERQGAESLWNQYLEEQEKNTGYNSEAEDDLNQDSLSCKCMPSLKYNLESLEESTQSKSEILMSNSCGPQMDSHSQSDQHTTVDSSTDIHKKPTMMPELKCSRFLNISPENHVDVRDCKYMKCEEEINDNQRHSRSESECQTLEENKTTQGNRSTAEAIGNEAREMDAADEGESKACEQVPWEYHGIHKLVKLTNVVNEIAMDITSTAPTMTESEEIASVGGEDIDRNLSQVMSSLGLTVTITEDQEKGLYMEEKNLHEMVQSLSPVDSQQEESRRLLHENRAPAMGRMSGLPEIGEMLYKQEIREREKAQKDLQGHLLQDCTTEGQSLTERVEMKHNRDINLDRKKLSELSDYDTHALETLRSSIVIRKQEVPIGKEAEKENPNVMDWVDSHQSHPTLVLAIRNNQLVKLDKQDEFQKWDKITSALGTSHPEAVKDTKLTRDESIFRKETSHLVDENLHLQQARDPGHAPVSHRGTDSSSEGSAYNGDSFEEDEGEEEDQVDEEPTYSEESCTNAGIRMPTTRTAGLGRLEMNEQFSPKSKAKVEGNQSRSNEGSPENWEDESEQGSYSPEEDVKVAASAEWLDTCGSQGTKIALGDPPSDK